MLVFLPSLDVSAGFRRAAVNVTTVALLLMAAAAFVTLVIHSFPSEPEAPSAPFVYRPVTLDATTQQFYDQSAAVLRHHAGALSADDGTSGTALPDLKTSLGWSGSAHKLNPTELHGGGLDPWADLNARAVIRPDANKTQARR